jgi:hypothetical protein
MAQRLRQATEALHAGATGAGKVGYDKAKESIRRLRRMAASGAKEIHYEPVPPELRLIIMTAWARGGLLPKADIEQMVPPELSS